MPQVLHHGDAGVGRLDRDGDLPPVSAHLRPIAPHRVLLRPGQSVQSRLHWHVFPVADENQTGQCQPQAAYLLVIPPDETQSIAVAWPEGPVCNHGRIEQTAYAAA